MGTLPDDTPPLVVAYCTPGPYRVEADRLIKSLNQLDIAHSVCVISPFDSWLDAVAWKPIFLREERERSPDRDLLFVDADAVFHVEPWSLLPSDPCDIGVHIIDREINSGTIFLPAKGKMTEWILDTWIERNKTAMDVVQPQRVLRDILAEDPYAIVTANLPPELCWIIDVSEKIFGKLDPVIEHLQASRAYRDGGREWHGSRDARIAALEKL